MTAYKFTPPHDPFTSEQKTAMLATVEYEMAYDKWIKSGLSELDSPELFCLMHGRTLKGDWAIQIPNSWRDRLFEGLIDKVSNFPTVIISNNVEYRRERIDLVIPPSSLEKGYIDFQDMMLMVISDEIINLIRDCKVISNAIYISRLYGFNSDLEFYLVYFDFEV